MPGSHQILAKTIQAGGEILWSEIHEFINSIWNTEELPDQWKESIIAPIHKKGDNTAINFIRNVIQYLSLKVKSIYRGNWGSSVWVST
jgi:hypothetical protein